MVLGKVENKIVNKIRFKGYGKHFMKVNSNFLYSLLFLIYACTTIYLVKWFNICNVLHSSGAPSTNIALGTIPHVFLICP